MVEDGLRVDLRDDAEGNTGREVGLDGARDDVDRRTLRSDNQVDADGTSQLGDTGYRGFHLTACGHDEVGKLIDDQHNVGQETVTFSREQPARLELLVVFDDVSALGGFEEVVTLVHLYAQGIECAHHFLHIGDDGIFRIGELGQIMALDTVVKRQFHLLRVDHDKFQLRGVLAVEQGSDDGIQSHRFTLTSSTCHQDVWHLSQVEDIGFIGDGLTDGARQGVF